MFCVQAGHAEGAGKPIYHIERMVCEDKVQFQDGEHIIYVNVANKTEDTALGRLMSDFFCTNANDMHYKELSDKVRYYKETEEGVDRMCEIWDEIRNEGRKEGMENARIKNAKAMIKDGVLPLEKIAEYSGLTLEKVRELVGSKSA